MTDSDLIYPPLEQTDLTRLKPDELTEAEKAELTRRYDRFVRHFRATTLAAAPSSGLARRVTKWRP